MEFRAQDHHHHHHQHHHNPHHATSATSSLNFSPSNPTGTSSGDRRRSLNGNNNTSSTLTSSQTPNTSCTNTAPTISPTPQTLTDANFQGQARPLQQLQLSSPPQAPPAAAKAASSSGVKYRECLKNHAASVGGSVFDGCGEFMPSGEDGSLEALKCAACSCHRNFHRKELENNGDGSPGNALTIYSPGSRRSSSSANPLQITPPPNLIPSPTGIHGHHHVISPHHHPHHPHPHHYHTHHHRFPIVQPMNVAYAGGTESSSEELNATADNSAPPNSITPYSSSSASKKRFRTKFTSDQKQRMLEFAERVGWRFQKQDEDLVDSFCSEVGIRRQVLKVWMHNNKSNNLKNQTTKHQLDHVSIMMGNMGPTSAGPSSTNLGVPSSAAIVGGPPTNATDVVMNQQVSDDAVDDDDEGLD